MQQVERERALVARADTEDEADAHLRACKRPQYPTAPAACGSEGGQRVAALRERRRPLQPSWLCNAQRLRASGPKRSIQLRAACGSERERANNAPGERTKTLTRRVARAALSGLCGLAIIATNMLPIAYTRTTYEDTLRETIYPHLRLHRKHGHVVRAPLCRQCL